MRLSFPLAAFAACALFLASSAGALAGFKSGSVTIVSVSGASHKFTVELATNEADREQGLMFRRTLAKDSGMLFLYPTAQPIAMWMKNTLIPLDMLFIRGDGVIVNVRERAVPQNLETIPSAGLVKAALELNGGTIGRLGIKPGDKVIGEGLGEEPQAMPVVPPLTPPQ